MAEPEGGAEGARRPPDAHAKNTAPIGWEELLAPAPPKILPCPLWIGNLAPPLLITHQIQMSPTAVNNTGLYVTGVTNSPDLPVRYSYAIAHNMYKIRRYSLSYYQVRYIYYRNTKNGYCITITDSINNVSSH